MNTLSLYPLDSRCVLLSNIVWTSDANGVPSLHQQKLWAGFPVPLAASGLTLEFGAPVGRVRIETADDPAGRQWRLLAEASLTTSPHVCAWPPALLNNVRIHVVEPVTPLFPVGGAYFTGVRLHVDAAEELPKIEIITAIPSVSLEDHSPAVTEPFAGHAGVHANEKLGLCHDRPQTNRLEAVIQGEGVEFTSTLMRMAFDRRHARITALGWDTYGQERQTLNLLSTAHTRGAFPVVMRDGRRRSCETSGGSVAVAGRTIRYQGIRAVPELAWDYAFTLRENGFSLELAWTCEKTFHASELAALRIPFDLYRSVTSVLAMPETTGPSGLVSLPMVINAPNHGVMRVTVRHTRDAAPFLARILPFRTRAELWLDLMPGVVPLPSGLFEMPAGRGAVTLDFELTKIFPFGEPQPKDIYTWWEMPPFYSFVDRDNILGALPNAWLTGLAFRPDLGRFANNSVADSAACCATYYADIAAYTPMLAEGLDSRQFIRIAAEQLLRDVNNTALYSDWRLFPNGASAPLDCAWLYVASSGDWEWAKRWREGIRFYTEALMQIEHLDTGLVKSQYSGRPEDNGSGMCAAWCDSVRTGHLESYVNALVYRAVQRAADLLERLDSAPLAGRARAMAARTKANFLPTFLDAESKQIMMWVDTDGRRYGLRSHFHLGAAIALGLVPDDLARALLADYLGRLSASGFTHYEWGLPIFLDPVPAAWHNGWKGKGVEPDGSDQVGVYQNGAIHSHQSYYILQALYKTGMRLEANDLFMKLTPLVRTGGLCGGLHSGLDWRHPVDGRASGYEGLLAEQFHFLLAAITGYLGCELTIDGLVVRGPDTDRIRNLRPNFARVADKGTK